MRLNRPTAIALVAAATMLGCLRQDNSPTLATLEVNPENARIPRGGHRDFVAVGTFSDGSIRDLTAEVEWTVDDGFIASADTTVAGRIHALNPGAARVRVAKGAVSRQLAFTVVNGPVVRLEVNPPRPTVPAGLGLRLTVDAVRADGSVENVTASALYAVVGGAAGVAMRDEAPGLLTGVTPGAAVLQVSFEGATATFPVEVTSAVVRGLTLTPWAPSLPVGLSQQLVATASLSDGRSLDVTEDAQWSSSAPDLVSVSTLAGERGLLLARGAGAVEISAQLGEHRVVMPLTATAATLSRLEATPSQLRLARGMRSDVVVMGIYSDGTRLDVSRRGQWTAPETSAVTVSPSGAVQANALGTAVVRFGFDGLAVTVPVTVTEAELRDLELSPATVTLPAGTMTALSATGRFTDGTTQDLTEQVLWTVTDASIAAVSNGSGQRGELLALSAGQTSLVGAIGTITTRVPVTVTAAQLVGLQTSPSVLSVPAGASVDVAVRGLFSDGTSRSVTAQAGFSSSDPAIVSVDPVTNPGRVTGHAPGQAQVIVTLSGSSTTVTVVVTPAELERLELSPRLTALPRGTSARLSVTGVFTDGSTQDLSNQAVWSTSNAAVASVSNAPGFEGVVQALSLGPVVLSADAAGHTGTLALVVSAPALQFVQVNPVGPSVSAGLSERLTATGVYSDSTTLDLTAQVTWSSSDEAVASVSNAAGLRGTVTGGAIGNATITATMAGVSGNTTVTVTPSVLQALQVTPPSTTRPKGLPVQLTATALFSDGSTQDLSGQVSWTTSDDGVVSVSNAPGSVGRAMANEVGSATLTATFGGVSGSATIIVAPAALAQFTASPAVASMPLGSVRQYQVFGAYTDGSSQLLTPAALWTSSDPSVVDVSNAPGSQGLVTSLGLGSATLTVSFGGWETVISVTVTQTPLVSLELTPAAGATPVGFTRQFLAIGTYADGTTSVLTTQVTWSSSDPALARISNAAGTRGLLSTVGIGAVSITATQGAVSATVSHTISAATLVGLSLSAPSFSLSLSETRQLTVTGTYSDGSTQDLTSAATWVSSMPGVVMVSNAVGSEGTAFPLSVGSAVITVSMGFSSAAATVTVTP
ncbi:MAG: Ig-like domain-containing protein [Myxococcaceae bacterium]|jgi:hypothetical protein|nr:Ig-like domain-containing protein [Myxococcaceae bacterium]MCA3014572.1 Ig-like domain-containing protein [Myxococcaceae bacterium]